MTLLRPSLLFLLAAGLPAAALAQESASTNDGARPVEATETPATDQEAQPQQPTQDPAGQDQVRADQERADQERAKAARRERALKKREELIKRADTDGDGQISAAERDAMLATLRAERQQSAQAKRARGGDASGTSEPATSKPTVAEQPAEPRPLPERFQYFDADQDGVLSPAEKARARRELKESELAGTAAPRKPAAREGVAPDDRSRAARVHVETPGASDRKSAVRQRLQAEREAEYGKRGGDQPTGTAGDSVMQRRKDAVARERARRAAIQKRLDEGLTPTRSGGRDALSGGNSLRSYRRLARVQPKVFKSKDGWKGGNRQGVQRGKKRGSEYYRKKISSSGRGRGGRGGGGRGRGGRGY